MAELTFDAIVVGAGPVGLAAALVLSEAHQSVLLVGKPAERFVATDDQPWDPRVFALSRKSQTLLESLRAWNSMPQDRIQSVAAMEVWGDGRALVDKPSERDGFLNFHAADAGVPALTWIVEQQSIVDGLEEAIQFVPFIERKDAVVVGLAREANGWAVVLDRDTVRAPIVIAADGANSLIRSQAGLDFDVEEYSAEGVVTTFACERDHLGAARQWFADDAVLAMLPLPENKVSMVWSLPLMRADQLKRLGYDALQQTMEQAVGGELTRLYGQLTPIGGLFAYPLRHGVAPQWYREGVVLMGDAAHVVHPLAGQGLNLGLEDVATLRDELLAISSEGERLDSLLVDSMWRRWERRRKAACQPVHWMTDALHNVFRLQLPGTQWVRNRGMRLINQLPVVKRWLIHQAMR